MKIFRHCPGNAETVVSAGAPADFVQDDQAPVRGVVEDIGGFLHFHQKGALAAGQVVQRSHPGENPIRKANRRIAGGQTVLSPQTSIDFGLVVRTPMIEITTNSSTRVAVVSGADDNSIGAQAMTVVDGAPWLVVS